MTVCSFKLSLWFCKIIIPNLTKNLSLFRRASLALPVRSVRILMFLETSVIKVGTLTSSTSHISGKNMVMYERINQKKKKNAGTC